MTRLIPLFLLTACASRVPTRAYDAPEPAVVDLSAPGPIVHEAVVSATWAVPTKGLIDLTDPQAAELETGKRDIVLPVHVLEHPTAGTFVVDSGVPAARWPTRGLMSGFIKDVQTVETLADITARHGGQPAGVLLTHAHLDHVLGLVDVPDSTVFAGEGEAEPANFNGQLMFGTFKRALGERNLTTWDFDDEDVVELGGLPAIDIVGDGSIYAIAVPGHTPGSTAYLARTADGPVLFTGDCSHTRWGWEHNVPPGTYTVDHDDNAESLSALRGLAESHPNMQVFVGHEL